MNVLMIGVDKTSVGGMLTVIENYLNNKEFCGKVNLQYIATVIRGSKLIKLKTFLKKIPEIKRTIKEKKIDIVHVHMAERGSVFREGYVVHIANKMGCKTIIHMHGATIEDWYKRQNIVVKKIIEKIFCSADKMIVLGDLWLPFMKKVMGNENESKLAVLHNAVNVPSSNSYNLDATEILFYGMLIQRKGIDDLLEAFRAIKDDLEGRAEYRGWLTPENREKVFSKAIVNVLPSYNEGLPMTILESMGHGIPNISTNIAAIPEAISDGINGYLITPGDINSLKEKMKNVILNRKIREKFSESAYETAKKEFSIDSHINRLLKIYKDILDD